MVRRAMPWRRASDIWATTGHTLPGMYLPSWLAENTATDSTAPSRLWSPPAARPMSASRMRQPTASSTPATTAAPADRTKRAAPTRGRASVTSPQLPTRAHTQAATRTTTSTGRAERPRVVLIDRPMRGP